MNCNICNQATRFILSSKLLGKYDVKFYQCQSCSFIQTEYPHWLEEAYSSAIASADIGLINRNILFAPQVEMVIDLYFDTSQKFIDYGGGYGMLVRMMRDKGLDFYRQDIYCENLFAKTFDVKDIRVNDKFELLTAFEVFEHLVNPMEEIEKMFSYSDNILFSTCIQPHANVTPENWWYFVPQTGQHVSLYSLTSLQLMARKFGSFFYKMGDDLFLFSKKQLDVARIGKIKNSRWRRWKYNRFEKKRLTSLLSSDFQKMLSA